MAHPRTPHCAHPHPQHCAAGAAHGGVARFLAGCVHAEQVFIFVFILPRVDLSVVYVVVIQALSQPIRAIA